MIKFALLGCGRIAKKHSELLGNGQIKNATLKSVCDIDLERAKTLGLKYDVPYYGNLVDMLNNEDIDVVSILTPSGNHYENVIEVANFNKHVIVEKPMALKIDHAKSMIKKCEENSVKLFVVKQNRFNLPIKKLKEALLNKRFGKLLLGTVRVRWCRDQQYYDQDKWRGTWEQDGGVLTNQASHHIDLLEWMMGEVESVFAKSATYLVDIEVEDTAIAILKFKNGAMGVIEATTATRPENLEGSISILGEMGTVEVGGFAVNEMKTWNFVNKVPEDDNILKDFSENPTDVYGFGHLAYYDHVVECIKNDTKQLVDGFEGKKSIELISAIYKSIETGKEIYLNSGSNSTRLGVKNDSKT